MDIRYRVVDDASTDLKLQQDLDRMILTLSSKFNIIEFEDSKVRCFEKSFEKVDGVLHFFFKIKLMIQDAMEKENNKLRNLELGVKLNG